MWPTIAGKAESSDSGWEIGMLSWTLSRTSIRDCSTTQLPEVEAVISSARMMSTPAATSVDSMREKRASVILRTVLPIFIGSRSFTRSQTRRPFSVDFHLRKAKILTPTAGKMMNQ